MSRLAVIPRGMMIAALLLAAGAVAPALAQPLGGPAVKGGAAPTGSASFGSGAAEGKARPERPVPMPAFLHAIHSTLGPEAPEALQLSEQQSGAIKEAADAHRALMKAYVDEHRDEIRELAKLRGPDGDRLQELLQGGPPRGREGPGGRGGPGGRHRGPHGPDDAPPPPPPPGEDGMAPPPPPPPPPGDEDGAPPDRAEARAKAKALMDGAPKPTDTQKQIWSLLRTEQQDAVQVKLDEMKARARERGGERMREKFERRGGGKGG